MQSQPNAPFFHFSRSAAEALLSRPEREELQAGFARRGFASLDRFLGDLAKLPQIEHTDLRTESRRHKDAHGTDFTCAITIKIKFKRLPLIQITGYGYGSSAREAKLISLAESLERLGFCLRGWRDSALPATSANLLETYTVTGNTNGACFHTSPLKALKGAFCELLERDAFLTTWYSDRRLPVSRISRIHRLYPWLRRFAAEGWDLREHAWLHDRVPAVVVALSLARKEPVEDQWNFFFGSAAAPGAAEAQGKALQEMLKSRRLSSQWMIGTKGRATPSQLRLINSRRILYQRPAFVRKFTNRLTLNPRAAPHPRPELSDRDFVLQCFRSLTSAKVLPLILPAPFKESAFCLQVVCEELQGLDWQIPPHYNLARIQSLYRTTPRLLCRLPHPLA